MQKRFVLPLSLLLFISLETTVLSWQVRASLPARGQMGGDALPHPGSDQDLETIRARVIADLLEPSINEEHIRSLLSTMRSDGSWPNINYEDVSRTGFEHSIHLQHMYQLSRAFKRPGSPFHQDKQVRSAALKALDFWLKHDFICDNWWWNEMGTPQAMINTLLVLDTDLNETQVREGLRIAGRANLDASGARPGGDLIQIGGMLAKQALFRRDVTVMRRVVDVMANEIRVVGGRGLQADMSFHHRVDKVICTLSYGLGYANAFSYWAVKTAGTAYALPDHASRLLIDYFLDGICKSMVHGRFPDPGAKNRDLSREGILRPSGPEIAENLLVVSDYRKSELEEIARIRRGEQPPDLTWNRFFWHSEYFTHQRPGYFASVRMHSSRNYTMEQPHNEEGLKMHHVGDGANFISRKGTEYLDIFPVWNWQKVPGTTVVQKAVHPHWREIAKKGRTDFVGAVSDERYGAAAFDFKSAHDPLRARKAWFFFDDEFVCLGTGIHSEADEPVVTTINQCLRKGDVVVKTKKRRSTLVPGDHMLSKVTSVMHDSIGYIFPHQQMIGLTHGEARGTWREINHQARTSHEPVNKAVFTLWLDHGTKPEQSQYAYVVLPGATPAKLDEYHEKSPVTILANTPSLQGVSNARLGQSHFVFYDPGKVKFDHIALSVDAPCMVMVKARARNIETLAVSDPSRKLSSLRLTTNTRVEGSGEEWQAVWDASNKESVIDISLPDGLYAGQSVVITLPAIQ